MIWVNTHEAKTNLSKLLLKVEQQNEAIVICRHGSPIAEVIPWKKTLRSPLKQSRKLKKIVFREDPSLPLDENDWPDRNRS